MRSGNPIVDDELGRRILIDEPPMQDDVERLRAADVRTAWIRGFGMAALPDLSILDGAIDDLNVITLNLTSDASVQTLPGLRSLSLQSYARSHIDIGWFPRLERLWTYWRPGTETALQATGLKALTIAKYPYPTAEPVAKLMQLEHLGIRNSRIESLRGIEHLPRLTKLELIDNRRLVDISALGTADCRLTSLRIHDCRRLATIDALANQRDLEELQLTDCGEVQSVRPLAGLPRLRKFWLYGTTNILDGDVAALLDFPALEQTAFAPRRHYSKRNDEVEAALAKRAGHQTEAH